MRALVGALAVVSLALAAPVKAQEAPPTTLTLERALQIAEGNNPAYRRDVNALGLNAVETRTMWSQLLPEPNISLFTTNYNGNIRRIAQDNFGNPIANPDAEWAFFSGTTQSLQFSWNLQGYSLFNQYDRQQRSNFDRQLAERTTRTTLQTNVRRQFFDALEQSSLLAVEEEIAAARQVDLDLAEQLFRLAQNSRVDVLTAELGVQQQEAALSQQRANVETSKLALARTLGGGDLGSFEVADEPLPIFDPEGLPVTSLLERASLSNPALLQAESSVVSQELGVKEAKNQWWPNLSLSYQIYRRAQGPDAGALFDVSPDEDLDQNFGATISFPFFNNFFGNQQSIEQAEVNLMNGRESLREARLQTEETVRSSLLSLENQYQSLQIAIRQLEIAEEALSLAREEYRLGVRTFSELQSTIDSESNARRGVITARFGFVDALLTLEEAVGAPVRGGGAVSEGQGEPGSTGQEG